MKEIMLPYILLVWLLFKFKLLKRTPSNYFTTSLIGVFLMVSLFMAHRFYSPADLTNSTTVKASHAILSPAFGQQIDRVYIDHNQEVKEGEVLYTLKDDNIKASIIEVESETFEIVQLISAKKIELKQAQKCPEPLQSTLSSSKVLKSRGLTVPAP